MVTGTCLHSKSNYRDIVQATSGQIFELNKHSNDISEVNKICVINLPVAF